MWVVIFHNLWKCQPWIFQMLFFTLTFLLIFWIIIAWVLKWSEVNWSRSVVSESLRPYGTLHPWDFPSKSTGVGCHFLPQRIFLTQGFNLGLPHCRQTLYSLSHEGSTWVLDIFNWSHFSCFLLCIFLSVFQHEYFLLTCIPVTNLNPAKSNLLLCPFIEFLLTDTVFFCRTVLICFFITDSTLLSKFSMFSF